MRKRLRLIEDEHGSPVVHDGDEVVHRGKSDRHGLQPLVEASLRVIRTNPVRDEAVLDLLHSQGRNEDMRYEGQRPLVHRPPARSQDVRVLRCQLRLES